MDFSYMAHNSGVLWFPGKPYYPYGPTPHGFYNVHVAPAPPLPPPSAGPTRAVLLSSVAVEVSESTVRREMEVFGDVRAVEMERVREGIVTVHFYDLRAALAALEAVRRQHVQQQGRLRRHYMRVLAGNNGLGGPFVGPPPAAPPEKGVVGGRAVWAQFVIPPANVYPDGQNQGTVVVFNLNSGVSDENLKQIFEPFGQVKEVRETPMKNHQKFVEFYDVRDAAKALSQMKGKEIHGKPLTIEFSRPGGYSKKWASFSSRVTKNPPPAPSPPRRAMTNLPPKKGCSSRSSEGSMESKNVGRKRGKGREYDKRYLIKEEEEEEIMDSRTTVMIRNIPNKYSQKLLLNMLDNHCIHCNEQISAAGGTEQQPFSSYDFLYLPIDFNNKCNVGYGFANMTSPEATLRLYKAFHHHHWEVFNSRKICQITYARIQGLEALKEHFKNSKFWCESEEYLPVVFSPPRDGRHLTPPLPIVTGQPSDPHDQNHDRNHDEDAHDQNHDRNQDEDDGDSSTVVTYDDQTTPL